MPWARIDDSLCDHPKTLDLIDRHEGLAALGLLTLLLSWSNRHLTDGKFSRATVERLGGRIPLVNMLVECGFVERIEKGWQIHDFATYSKSRERVTEDRAAWRQRQMSRRDKSVSHASVTNGVTPVSNSPVPVPGVPKGTLGERGINPPPNEGSSMTHEDARAALDALREQMRAKGVL